MIIFSWIWIKQNILILFNIFLVMSVENNDVIILSWFQYGKCYAENRISMQVAIMLRYILYYFIGTVPYSINTVKNITLLKSGHVSVYTVNTFSSKGQRQCFHNFFLNQAYANREHLPSYSSRRLGCAGFTSFFFSLRSEMGFVSHF